MSPWGRWILEHIELTGDGYFARFWILDHARIMWPQISVRSWWAELSQGSRLS